MNKKLRPKAAKVITFAIISLGVLDLVMQWYFRGKDMGIANIGVSLGIFSGQSSVWITVLELLIVIILLITAIMGRVKHRQPLAMVITGGLVNVSQRIIYGSVWDYIKLPLMPFSNNLADILITMGLLLFILDLDYGN